MRSSDTPESERRELLPHDHPDLQRGPQGPIDWSKEIASDDLLSGEARRRLQELFEAARDAADTEA